MGPLLGQAILKAFPDVQLIAVGGGRPAALPGAENTRSLIDTDAEAERLADYAPDIVLHLGGLTSVAAAGVDAPQIMTANLGGAVRLAQALRRRQGRTAFLLASSGEVYGDSFVSGEVNEASPLQPKNSYARSKAASEYALTDMLGDRGPVVILRLFNHTGPGQDERFVIPSFAAQIARIERGTKAGPLRVGNLSAERDFLHVDDVIAAYMKVIAAMAGMPAGAQTFNVCSSASLPIQSLLDGLVGMASAPISVEIDPARLRPSEIPVAAASGARFRAAFGWRPAYSMQDTLRDVLDFWRARTAEER